MQQTFALNFEDEKLAVLLSSGFPHALQVFIQSTMASISACFIVTVTGPPPR
jgi:hypothetical protein